MLGDCKWQFRRHEEHGTPSVQDALNLGCAVGSGARRVNVFPTWGKGGASSVRGLPRIQKNFTFPTSGTHTPQPNYKRNKHLPGISLDLEWKDWEPKSNKQYLKTHRMTIKRLQKPMEVNKWNYKPCAFHFWFHEFECSKSPRGHAYIWAPCSCRATCALSHWEEGWTEVSTWEARSRLPSAPCGASTAKVGSAAGSPPRLSPPRFFWTTERSSGLCLPFSLLPTLQRWQPHAPASGAHGEALPARISLPLPSLLWAGACGPSSANESWGRSAAEGLQGRNTNRKEHLFLLCSVFSGLYLLVAAIPQAACSHTFLFSCLHVMPETAVCGRGRRRTGRQAGSGRAESWEDSGR